jgi:hypothetical protein
VLQCSFEMAFLNLKMVLKGGWFSGFSQEERAKTRCRLWGVKNREEAVFSLWFILKEPNA